MEKQEIKYVGRWRQTEYDKWTTRYFDTLEELREYWFGFHSVLAPKCFKESFKVTYEPINID